MENGKIKSITCMSGNLYEGKVFIDCSYEGDLMASSGVSFFVGREGNARYGETMNGVKRLRLEHNQFERGVDPFRVFGHAQSGLLRRISTSKPHRFGEADPKIPAYNYLLCLTQVEENQVPFLKPDGYDPLDYELLLRYILNSGAGAMVQFDEIPNAKMDTDNFGPFSTNNIGMNYEYPNASYEKRKLIIKEHEQYQKGYFYFLGNDTRVPAQIRTEMKRWGLAKDEFIFNQNWPGLLYVREARRMIGSFVMTEHEVTGDRVIQQPIGMASRGVKVEHVQRYVSKDKNGHSYVANEGEVHIPVDQPYAIAYESIVPRKAECQNLLVPVCLSASHVAFGAIRSEPVYMILGQSAATAATLAIEKEIPVQGVNYKLLQERLLADNQVISYTQENRISYGRGIELSALGGVVVDGEDLVTEGEWTRSSSLRPYIGSSYLHDGNGGKGMSSVRFPFVAPAEGLHEIKVAYGAFGNRARNIRYEISHAEGRSKVFLSQRTPHRGSEVWSSLGTFSFKKGENYDVSLYNENTEGYVVADAIQVIAINP